MVFPGFWIRAFEVWLTTRLLASPSFHRAVARVHQRVQRIRYGPPPEEMGGTKLDNNGPGVKKLFEYFKEEIKDQFKGRPPNKL